MCMYHTRCDIVNTSYQKLPFGSGDYPDKYLVPGKCHVFVFFRVPMYNTMVCHTHTYHVLAAPTTCCPCNCMSVFSQDRFEESQVMPTERFRAAAVNASEYVYLFGGRDLNGSLVSVVFFRVVYHLFEKMVYSV